MMKNRERSGDGLTDRTTGKTHSATETIDRDTTAATGCLRSSLGARTGHRRPGPAAEENPAADTARPASATNGGPAFTGNKTEFLAALVRARGNTGATPKEIDQAFVQQGITRSRNLIYNTLRSLVQRRQLKRQGERYVAVALAARSGQKKQKGAAPAASSRPAAKKAGSAAPKTAAGVRARRAGTKKGATKKATAQAGRA